MTGVKCRLCEVMGKSLPFDSTIDCPRDKGPVALSVGNQSVCPRLGHTEDFRNNRTSKLVSKGMDLINPFPHIDTPTVDNTFENIVAKAGIAYNLHLSQ